MSVISAGIDPSYIKIIRHNTKRCTVKKFIINC